MLVLDRVTRSSLELVRTLREGAREGSLLGVMDRTKTARRRPAAQGLGARAARAACRTSSTARTASRS